ncbi:MAG: YicC/YloC family endoribonuclease [Nitrospiraceae bacterium]
MTGYGRREVAWPGGSVAVEIRSVNHRHCEILIRLPKGLSSLEESLKRMIQGRCQRGRIEVTISLFGRVEGEKQVSLDRSLARQYYAGLQELKTSLRIGGQVDLALLAGFREIFAVSEKPLDDRHVGRKVSRITTGALADLDRMRRREGQALARDIRQRLTVVRRTAQAIAVRAPGSVREHFERMHARIAQLSGTESLDPNRMAQELALQADRCDITEELTRLGSHVTQFDAALAGREPVGRTLDFLLQEMGREVNTVGSKAIDAEIAGHVVRLKSEMEKIREQVQNIE